MSLIWHRRAALNTPIAPLVFTTTKQLQSWTIKATAGAQYRFDWGDGTSTTVTGNGADQVTTHDYGSAGTRVIQFGMRDWAALLTAKFQTNGLTGALPNFGVCPNLAMLYAFDNAFSGAVIGLDKCTKLVSAYLSTNAFTGPIPALASPLLVTYGCDGNQFDALPSLAACPSLQFLYAQSNKIAAYTSQVIPVSASTWQININLLPAAAINSILANMAAGMASRPPGGTLIVSGAGNAAPTGQGLLDKATIAARPWTCTTNT